MYKEVALDPSSLVSMEYYNLVKQHFGFEHGRYISADIESWAKEAMKFVKGAELQEIKKQSVKNFLNKLVRAKNPIEFCLARDRKSVVSDHWNDWLQKQLAIRPFSFAISESSDFECIGVDAINAGDALWKVDRSVSVDRSTIDLFRILKPLILISNTVTLVDQHFRLATNRNLVELFRIASEAGIGRLTVVTAMETPDPAGLYARDYQTLNTNGFQFIWIKAPEKYFHDRYFITDVGAIRSGHGFMTEARKGAHADMANLNIIGKDEADRTLEDLEQLQKTNKAEVQLHIEPQLP